MAKLVVRTPRPRVTNDLQVLHSAIATCTDCALHQYRINSVAGQGHVGAKYMIIGEAPGGNENLDQQGRPFIGRAGKVLNDMLNEVGVLRGDCFITNMVKCWPGPGNPDPTADEIAACSPWLDAQITLVQPKGIITFGRFSTGKYIDYETMGRIHGHIRRVVYLFGPVYIMGVYHPAYVARNPMERPIVVEALRTFFKLFNEE